MPECLLVRRRDESRVGLAAKLGTPERSRCRMREVTRNLDGVWQLSQSVAGVGWENHAADAGDANGRFEEKFELAGAHHVGPGCVRLLHGRVVGAGPRTDGDLRAEVIREPSRHRLPVPVSAGDRTAGTCVRATASRIRVGPPVRTRLLVDRRGEGRCERVHRRDRPDRQFVEAGGRRRADERRPWPPAYMSYYFNNPLQMLRIPNSDRIEDRAVEWSWKSVPAGDNDGRGWPSTGSSAVSSRRAELREPVRDASRRAPRGGHRAAPANLLDSVCEDDARGAAAARTVSATAAIRREGHGGERRARVSGSPSGKAIGTWSFSE